MRPSRSSLIGRVTSLALVASASASLGCGGPQPPEIRGEAWPEANRLFTDDPWWRGGDGAYTVDLGGGRVLWLFGDSFVGPSDEAAGSVMVRNSVALQTGLDPTRAFMRFYWRTVDGRPASFVPETGPFWYWPGHGIRVGDRLLLFYGRVFQESPGMWGFRAADATAFLVDNPDDEPSAWHMTEAHLDLDPDVDLSNGVLRIDDKVYVYGSDRNTLPRSILLARFDLARALGGDLTGAEWWTGGGWGDRAQRHAILGFGASELSVHFAAALGLYVMVHSSGSGATTLSYRTAPRPEGPWTAPRDAFRPPESFYDDAFVYAGKAHPELLGADLVATYVPSSFETLPPEIGDPYYHPFFARLTFPAAGAAVEAR